MLPPLYFRKCSKDRAGGVRGVVVVFDEDESLL